MSEDKYRAALDMAAKQLSYRALSAKMLRDKLLARGTMRKPPITRLRG